MAPEVNDAAKASGSDPQQQQARTQTDVLEERLIEDEYKIWKKNTPFLYNWVSTHSLEWPSLTCQWIPHTRSLGHGIEEHSLLIGTHTSGEQNYLMMARCTVPNDDDVLEDENKNTNADGGTNKGGSSAGVTSSSLSGGVSKVPAPQYNEDKNEMGGFGHADSSIGKIEIKVKIKHDGEVNRARHMPQKHYVVASRGPQSLIYIWNIRHHPSNPDPNSVFSPQGVCVGHDSEGYGMAWSPVTEGHLATASEDQTVRLWDIANGGSTSIWGTKSATLGQKNPAGQQFHPLSTFRHHTATVEDVDWHHKDANLMASVGDDKLLVLWDTRSKSEQPQKAIKNAHADDINSVAFNPLDQFMVATGSSDKTIGIWDLRKFEKKMHTLDAHTSDVYMVKWCWHDKSILGSCAADRRVAVWDLDRIGREQSPEDAEDGPPELLFLHGGHTSRVSDFDWNPKTPFAVASASEDNILQVWHMAEEIYGEDDDGEERNPNSAEQGGLADNELE